MDHLVGLKENVILGKLIPAGTGMKRYRSIQLHSDLVDSLDPPDPVFEETTEETETEEDKEAASTVEEPDAELDVTEEEELEIQEDEELVALEE